MHNTQQPAMDSGCTAVVALLRNNDLYVANAGDSRWRLIIFVIKNMFNYYYHHNHTTFSFNHTYQPHHPNNRCVVCRDSKAHDMSVDHKPEDVEERMRIEKAGGKITFDGRVNGGLNLSRAIGGWVVVVYWVKGGEAG